MNMRLVNELTRAQIAALDARIAELEEALRYALRVGKGWAHDTNPHGDLAPGESADADAARLFCEDLESVLNRPGRKAWYVR